MKRLTKLTTEQEAMFPAIRDEWIAVGLSTERADRQAAEAAVAQAYRAANLEPPRVVIWVPSPMGGAIAQAMVRLAGVLAGVRAGVGAGVLAGVRAGVRDGVGAGVWDGVGAGVWDGVLAGVWAGVGAGVLAGVRDGVGALPKPVQQALFGWHRDLFWGQHEAAWLSFYDTFTHFGLHDITAPLDGLMGIARNAGWAWFFRDVAILTERPLRISIEKDRQGVNRLHALDGPAIVYPDGWGVWSVHGVRVPRDVVETPPEDITGERIRKESNAEVRRILMERVGSEALVERLGAEECGTDDWGTLLRIERPDDTPWTVVRVVNSTPEPDGSFHEYLLRVQPAFADKRRKNVSIRLVTLGQDGRIVAEHTETVPRTPHAAVASTFGLTPAEYQPLAQT